MPHARYLILGSSHAAIEAVAAIRMVDAEGGLVMITKDARLPYSPTVLPYIVSGRSDPERIMLRDEDWLRDNAVSFVRDSAAVAVDAAAKAVKLAGGAEWTYDKLLIATGAAPAIPPVDGLAEVPFHVLRSMEDALKLRSAMEGVRSAVVLGAGLVGMHAAENLAKAGLEVTIVEREGQVLPGYFDGRAAAMIEIAFTEKGVRLLLGRTARSAAAAGGKVALTLEDGQALAADLLLVATGVRPVIEFLAGSGIEIGRGVVADARMRTRAADVWAAGDVVEARPFLNDGRAVGGILPDAVEQGRIAGMGMAGDDGLKPWPGGLPINTYTFFGQRAVTVGSIAEAAGLDVVHAEDPTRKAYTKVVFDNGRLRGVSAVNSGIDAGVMWQLILRRMDLAPVREAFLARPVETGRALMSRTWR